MSETELRGDLMLLKQSIETLSRKIDEYAKDQRDLQDSMSEVLHGNGRGTGLILKVDRLETSEKRREKTFWLTVSTALGLLAKIVYDWMTQKGGTP